MTMVAYVYIQDRQYRVAENTQEVCQFSRKEGHIKARTRLGLSTIILFSSPLSVSDPSPSSSRYVMHHRRYPFDILKPGNSSMASTPNPSMRKTRGLPRRDHNALHNGLVSSPSEQSEEPTCGTGRAYSPETWVSMCRGIWPGGEGEWWFKRLTDVARAP